MHCIYCAKWGFETCKFCTAAICSDCLFNPCHNWKCKKQLRQMQTAKPKTPPVSPREVISPRVFDFLQESLALEHEQTEMHRKAREDERAQYEMSTRELGDMIKELADEKNRMDQVYRDQLDNYQKQIDAMQAESDKKKVKTKLKQAKAKLKKAETNKKVSRLAKGRPANGDD